VSQDLLELGVRWYIVVYILHVYRVLTPRELRNQVVNLQNIATGLLCEKRQPHIGILATNIA
jgi:hypothetical protein